MRSGERLCEVFLLVFQNVRQRVIRTWARVGESMVMG